MRHLPIRLLTALIAMVAAVGLVAACGGDDEPAAEPVTVTERVTEPDFDAIPGPDEGSGSEGSGSDGSGSDGGTGTISDEELDAAVRAYTAFGFTEDQARCVIQRAQELSETVDTEDPSAVIGAGGLEIFSDCGIDLADIASQFGGTP